MAYGDYWRKSRKKKAEEERSQTTSRHSISNGKQTKARNKERGVIKKLSSMMGCGRKEWDKLRGRPVTQEWPKKEKVEIREKVWKRKWSVVELNASLKDQRQALSCFLSLVKNRGTNTRKRGTMGDSWTIKMQTRLRKTPYIRSHNDAGGERVAMKTSGESKALSEESNKRIQPFLKAKIDHNLSVNSYPEKISGWHGGK